MKIEPIHNILGSNTLKGLCAILLLHSSSLMAQEKPFVETDKELDRIETYQQELVKYVTEFIADGYSERARLGWNSDYSSQDALVRSVEPNRRRWSEVIKPPVLRKTGPLTRKPYQVDGVIGEWISLPLGGIKAEGFLAFPEDASSDNPTPLVIALHGIGSAPETPFEDGKSYHAYAKALLDAGFAVFAPLNMRSVERRNGVERLTRLAAMSLPGIELARLQHILDIILVDPKIDPERVGAWGVSLGGMATMFWMPLEPRIKVGVISAWFNHRISKMVIPDSRVSSFAPTEEHAFFNGWLTEFSDDDVISLICPRPVLIQHGKKDGIAYYPQVVDEFERASVHYERLDISDQFQLDLHEGGHEAVVKSGVDFLKNWLQD
ncbi:MAG: hypothetical protein IPL46_04635 [Saprospiraceae bacterium]|nr:hypothetical protein [Saprospiraceae bacterium]